MGGVKRANKKSTKGVRKVWRKGQSSSFNPSFNKFRTEAKKRGVFGNQGFSNLTEARIAEHNKLSCDKQCEDMDESMSIGGDTAISAISAFTNCSLPTFNRLISNWNAGSLLHKEMIAVLAAVADVLKLQGGKETETEYFAALMTTLDIVDTDEGVTAVICLLSMVVKRLNENVLKHESDVALEKFFKLLLKYMNTDHGALLRNLMKVVYAFLSVKKNWSDSDCEKLKILLEFTIHHKPKVRRAAHQIIRSLIIDGSRSSVVVHPGCAIVTEFCIEKLQKGGGPTASKDVFYVLSLLEEILCVFPKSAVKSISETILSVMTLSNSMLTSACLKTLRGLFIMEPKSDTLPADLNARIITAMYEYQPNVKETNSLINWLSLMESAFINLRRLDEKLCIGHLPNFYGKAVKCWQNEKEEVLETVTAVLKNLLYECIRPTSENLQQPLLDVIKNSMNKMFYHVEESLTYQYHKAWKYILIVLAAFFEIIGKYCYKVILKACEEFLSIQIGSVSIYHELHRLCEDLRQRKEESLRQQKDNYLSISIPHLPEDIQASELTQDILTDVTKKLEKSLIKEASLSDPHLLCLITKERDILEGIQKELLIKREEVQQKIGETLQHAEKCLQSLAGLHDTYKFPHIGELERAVGMAIQHMGPRKVIAAIPLQLSANSDKPDFTRSWLLPLLRDYIKKTDLIFFTKFFMPLAVKLKDKVCALQQEQKIIESKLCEVLLTQIWALLPGFCNEPTDLRMSFVEVAQTLGMLLKDEPSRRMTVLSSLRLLINKNMENEKIRMELARFSKNYVPILFNLYLTESKDKNEERVRLSVYDTCKMFLQITDKELCKTFFDKALDQLMESNASDFMQQSLIDICRAILPYIDAEDIKKIYDYCKPLLKASNHTTQKKSYSVLNEICSSESKSCALFVKKNLEDIRPLLCGSISGLTPATKALRLNILGHIIKGLPRSEKEFVTSVVPESVLCTKENSVKARAAAFNLLIVIGNTLLLWNPNDQTGAMYEYLKVLLAGLAGSPHLVSATVLAIGRVLYEFKEKMDSHLIRLLVENMCLLLTSKSREVVVSAMSFTKILFSVMDNADLAEHVETMVTSITSISKDNQRPFRFKAKEIFTRLIRKFGYEMIAKLVPEDYQKQITHIRKMEARKARKKTVDDEDDDLEPLIKNKASEGFDAILADSDEDIPLETDTEKPTKQSRKKRKTVETVIEEGEDDIIDLLDPSINKKLLTKMPEVSAVKKTEKDFRVSDDGRLIITEEDDTTSKSKDKEMDERREILAELGAFKKKKRKHQEIEDFVDDDDMTNKPVLKGIHRTLEPKTKKAPGAEFKAKKAGGDIKKGKYDPFVYIPLNKQMLNKRKQVKVKGQFKNLIKGAKKGATTGVKRKMRQARRKKNRN